MIDLWLYHHQMLNAFPITISTFDIQYWFYSHHSSQYGLYSYIVMNILNILYDQIEIRFKVSQNRTIVYPYSNSSISYQMIHINLILISLNTWSIQSIIDCIQFIRSISFVLIIFRIFHSFYWFQYQMRYFQYHHLDPSLLIMRIPYSISWSVLIHCMFLHHSLQNRYNWNHRIHSLLFTNFNIKELYANIPLYFTIPSNTICIDNYWYIVY